MSDFDDFDMQERMELRTEVERLRAIAGNLEITLVKECNKLRAEVERLTAERDEWKARWTSLARASLIAGTMTLEQEKAPSTAGPSCSG